MASRSPLDEFFTYIGCCILIGPPILLVSSSVLSSVPTTPILLFIVLLVAIPVTWLYQRTGKSLGDLGTFIFVTAALSVSISLSLTVAARTFDAVPSTETLSKPPVTFVILAIVYAVGYFFVYRGGYARLKSTVAESI